MVDFLSLVIESVAAANHSAGTTEIEYPLLESVNFLAASEKTAWKMGTGANYFLPKRQKFAPVPI
jgi:hypothetical protein